MSNLLKLQKLCDKVNTRYHKGLNDDDAVKAMFDFAGKIKDAKVIIGYDTYRAMSTEVAIEHQKNATEFDENGWFRVFIEHLSFKVKREPLETTNHG